MSCGIYATKPACGDCGFATAKRPDCSDRFRFDLVNYATEALTIALTGESRFETALLSGRNKECVPLNFANNIFLLHFSLKAAQSTFKRFAIA